MILATSNKAQRLLYLKMFGKVTVAEMLKNSAEVKTLVAEFDAGFRLLNDLTDLQSMDEDCTPVLGEIMDVLRAKGIEMVVRIIPDPRKDIGLNILSVFHYGRKVRTMTCATMQEAARFLKP